MLSKRTRKSRAATFVILLLGVCIAMPMLIFADDLRAETDPNAPAKGGGADDTAPSILNVAFDPQPQTKADVQVYLDAFEQALLEDDFEAALAAKPHWEHPVDTALMPANWRTALVADDGFGADYYTFFVEILPLSC